MTWPLKIFPGKRVDANVGGLAEGHIDDVGFVDFDLSGDDGHIGQCHQGRALGVLNAFDDRFSFADRQVGYDAIKRSNSHGFAKKIDVGAQRSFLGIQMAASRLRLCLGLGQGRIGLRKSSNGQIVGCFLGVKILLGHDLGIEEALGAVEI